MGTKITNLEFEQLEKDNESEEDEEEWFDAAELQVEFYNSEEEGKMEDVGVFKLGYAQAKQQLQKVVHNTEEGNDQSDQAGPRWVRRVPAGAARPARLRHAWDHRHGVGLLARDQAKVRAGGYQAEAVPRESSQIEDCADVGDGDHPVAELPVRRLAQPVALRRQADQLQDVGGEVHPGRPAQRGEGDQPVGLQDELQAEAEWIQQDGEVEGELKKLHHPGHPAHPAAPRGYAGQYRALLQTPDSGYSTTGSEYSHFGAVCVGQRVEQGGGAHSGRPAQRGGGDQPAGLQDELQAEDEWIRQDGVVEGELRLHLHSLQQEPGQQELQHHKKVQGGGTPGQP